MNYDSGLFVPANNFPKTIFLSGLFNSILWSFGKGEMYSTANDAVKAELGIGMFHVNRPEQSFSWNKRQIVFQICDSRNVL